MVFFIDEDLVRSEFSRDHPSFLVCKEILKAYGLSREEHSLFSDLKQSSDPITINIVLCLRPEDSESFKSELEHKHLTFQTWHIETSSSRIEFDHQSKTQPLEWSSGTIHTITRQLPVSTVTKRKPFKFPAYGNTNIACQSPSYSYQSSYQISHPSWENSYNVKIKQCTEIPYSTLDIQKVIVELENSLTVMDCDLSSEPEIILPLKKLSITPPISISTRLSPSLSPRTKSPHSPTQFDLGFAGSFQESLLSGHMSSMKSSACTGFIANLSTSSSSRNMMNSEHVKIPFDAHHYHVEDSVPPYVASIFLPKGRHRIDPVGKIQLTIFNPNKTPIKTLLVRYDLSDMPRCSKSFIRQIIKTGSRLQYATHFRVTCSKRGRIYLRDSIRIVFPLRQPDEHHQLDISYQYPDNPRYYPC